MMSSALAVGRSAGDINSVAVARQWMQRRLQPLVTSQKIRRGLNSLLAPCANFRCLLTSFSPQRYCLPGSSFCI